MKFIRNIVLVALALCAFSLAVADGPPKVGADYHFQTNTPPATFNALGFYDVRLRKFSAVVGNKLHDLTVNGKATKFEIDGFVGANVDSGGHAVAGLSLSRKWQWFDQFFFQAGAAISFNGGSPVGGGFLVGAGFNF